MQDTQRDISAVEAIRCILLARESPDRGREEAACRWEARAAAWFHRVQPTLNLTKELRSPEETRSAG